MQFSFVTVIPKYLKSATVSKDLLAVILSYVLVTRYNNT